VVGSVLVALLFLADATLENTSPAIAALADLMINIDKSTQRMTVTVDGKQIYKVPAAQ
jgi:hypothetical protein